MSKREHQYWHQALLKAFGDAKDDSEEEWFFFHWFWANRGVDTLYVCMKKPGRDAGLMPPVLQRLAGRSALHHS